ncbi:MAG TPA: GGDEF domain-containing protein [Candidatus Polarisedimenticolia bacterium]|jgi:diguanylate cyclase (GGDEF)-like protein
MNHEEAGPALPVRVLIVGPDQHRLTRTAERLEQRGFRCSTAASSSPASLRGRLLEAPDVIVAIEVGGSWQPTRRLLERDTIQSASLAAAPPAAPVLVLSDGAGPAERVEALASQGSGVWDWVEFGCPADELAARIGRLARVRRMSAQIDDLTRRCAEMETVDRITGLPNHRAFQEHLTREFRRAQRYVAPLSLLMIDVDRFRSLNEAHGHEFGDRVLREAARGLRSLLREVDMAARYGGEEFALLLPETDAQAALAVAGRVRGMIGSLPELLGSASEAAGAASPEPLRITASVGVASYPHEGTATRGLLLAAAESALRRAKDEGRNRALLFTASSQSAGASEASSGRTEPSSSTDPSATGWSGGAMNR